MNSEIRCCGCNQEKCNPESCANKILGEQGFLENGLPLSEKEQLIFDESIFSTTIPQTNNPDFNLGIFVHRFQNWVPAEWQPKDE